MALFNILPEDFFKPLTSKYKTTYIDCLLLIYEACQSELSFGVEKEIILAKLEYYFDEQSPSEMVFDEEDEIARDSRSKASAILRRLKDSGWFEYERFSDYRDKLNLQDYAITVIESFNKIIKNEEMEYQSLISQIHATIMNQEAYAKPYEYIIKRVIENTEELMAGLKKLNSSIRKSIEAITNDKDANEIVTDFFVYHREIGSKAYHRIKTSDNISNFRTAILEGLTKLLNDQMIFERSVQGYMEIEQLADQFQAREKLRREILKTISAYRNFDEIIAEIDYKHSRYMSSAVARAKFLLTNTNNAEGKISKILADLAKTFNDDVNLNLNDESDDALFQVFNIFPQQFLDSDSLYVMPISSKMATPEVFSQTLGLSQEERERRKQTLQEKNRNRFSAKNINIFVKELLQERTSVLASTLPLDTRRDLIRIIFIQLYGKDKKSVYHTSSTKQTITRSQFQFQDFLIERGDNW